MQGWVSIHRKIMNNPVWQDPQLLKLWMLCLLEASHKEHEQLVGKQIVKLQPGEFVIGRFALAKSYNEGAKKRDVVPESTLWRWLKWLENNDFLNIKSSTKFSVVAIKNWDKYQQNEQQMDSKWTANEQQMNTNNNGNKGNNLSSSSAREEDVFRFYQQNIQNGVSSSPYVLQNIQHWINEMSTDLVLAAMKVAANKEKRGFDYTEGILKKWSNAGIKTLDDARKLESEFTAKKKSNVVEWKQPSGRDVPKTFEYDMNAGEGG